ncbi:MAG: deoxyguanosinetriphosphate triphosphohydrolase [Clostridia bacterium]
MKGGVILKETVYEIERKYLCNRAFLSENTKGRIYPIPECPIRTDFQRDRDRIIHSKSFRRLMHKMQIFLAPEGDHYRTRLTHTLEVTQIARTLARSMLLNEDLTEAAALGHDLGHTPFGHAGERTLNNLCEGGFRHYEQSLRVADVLENLNLTYEVRDGIFNHSGDRLAKTLEGQIIKFADKIAYINHDIDDAIRAKVLRPEDLPKELTDILGNTHSKRISVMVSAVIEFGTDSNIGMIEPYFSATLKLREFLFKNVYFNANAKSEELKVDDMLAHLFNNFKKYPEKLPNEYKKNIEKDGIDRSVCDYIACMTDRYALATYEQLFIPKVWQYK